MNENLTTFNSNVRAFFVGKLETTCRRVQVFNFSVFTHLDHFQSFHAQASFNFYQIPSRQHFCVLRDFLGTQTSFVASTCVSTALYIGCSVNNFHWNINFQKLFMKALSHKQRMALKFLCLSGMPATTTVSDAKLCENNRSLNSSHRFHCRNFHRSVKCRVIVPPVAFSPPLPRQHTTLPARNEEC